MKKMLLIMMVLAGFTAVAFGDWRSLGTLNASSKQQEVAVNQQISKVLISCREGTITVERVVIVAEGRETPFNMTSLIAKGERQQITVGNQVECEKLLLQVSGQGQFEVSVRR